MKKIFAALVAMFMVAIMFAPSASATGNGHGNPPADNKKVELCHATGSETNPYTHIEVSVSAFYNAGHIDHEGDIWAAFSYTTKRGDVVNVPAQGDQSLLALDCVKPVVDKEIPVPDVTALDPCGIDDDRVVIPASDKYTSSVTENGLTKTVVLTAVDGFKFKAGEGVSENGKTYTETFTFTNADCDLPETGGVVTNVLGGAVALALLAAGGLFLYRRRGSDSTV